MGRASPVGGRRTPQAQLRRAEASPPRDVASCRAGAFVRAATWQRRSGARPVGPRVGRLTRERYCAGVADKVNLGCGLDAVDGWLNLDRSPSVLLRRFGPLKSLLHRVGVLADAHMVEWPNSVVRHDVQKGLPVADGSVEAIYTSHMLEHLPLPVVRDVLRECRRAQLVRVLVGCAAFGCRRCRQVGCFERRNPGAGNQWRECGAGCC